jgi:AAA domain, putative AbiEii toxin, Type IV TA system
MYLRRLHVQNVKLLRDVQVDFRRPDGSPRMWTVFVGENRLCKTTLLQTIAAAAAGRDQAVHLTTNEIASWPDLRRKSATISIDAEFGFGEIGHATREYYEDERWLPPLPPLLSSSLKLQTKSTVLDGEDHFITDASHPMFLEPLKSARRAGLMNWIVLAYGTSRVLRSPAAAETRAERDFSTDRLKSLFGAELIGTGFIELLEPELGVSFVKILQRVLVDGGLLPHVTALELRGRGGIRSHRNLVEAQRFEMDINDDGGERIRIPAKWLSDGYQSAIAWIADLVGQFLIDDRLLEATDPADMEGCVLIDEIDLRLHPAWQVRLIPALKKAFPRIQFIATTHSPMMLPALSADEVYVLTQDAEGSVVATQATHSPALLTGSELYEEFFDIRKLYPNDLGDKSRHYGRLASDPIRTDEEDARMHMLRKELDALSRDAVAILLRDEIREYHLQF